MSFHGCDTSSILVGVAWNCAKRIVLPAQIWLAFGADIRQSMRRMIWLAIYLAGVVVSLVVVAWKRRWDVAGLAFFWPFAISIGIGLLYFWSLMQLDKAGAMCASRVPWKKAIGYTVIGLAFLLFLLVISGAD